MGSTDSSYKLLSASYTGEGDKAGETAMGGRGEAVEPLGDRQDGSHQKPRAGLDAELEKPRDNVLIPSY